MTSSSIPPEIQALADERAAMRSQKNFAESDRLRKEIEDRGYRLTDSPTGAILEKIADTVAKAKAQFLLLFGSGEISPTGRRIHEYAMERIGLDRIHIAILSTPAGFQPNVKIVSEELADFFTTRLQNYHPEVTIIYANDKDQANDPAIVDQINAADYIFAGPGSPSYTHLNLKGTLLLQRLIERYRAGATIALSSAAAIAFSRYSLPVYEIFKVGTPLHWDDGLDFFRDIYKPMTLVAHFNNSEGGEKTDTSFCYMGRERFAKMLGLLPPEEPLLCIDEQTALVVEMGSTAETVLGKGSVYRATPNQILASQMKLSSFMQKATPFAITEPDVDPLDQF